MKKEELFPKLSTYCDKLPEEFIQIPDERKAELKDIANFIVEQRKEHKPANLLFVCTSNSRRSHMAQVWSQIASYYYNIDSVFTFSGGTEQTRVNINAIDALNRTGIEIYSNNQGDNQLRYVRVGNKINLGLFFLKNILMLQIQKIILLLLWYAPKPTKHVLLWRVPNQELAYHIKTQKNLTIPH